MSDEVIDLFGKPGHPPWVIVPTFEPFPDVEWKRIPIGAESCEHCRAAHRRDKTIVISKAGWRRRDEIGSVLYVCTGHAEQQKNREHQAAQAA